MNIDDWLQYTLCDLVLLFQVYYYRRKRQHRAQFPSESPRPLFTFTTKTLTSTWFRIPIAPSLRIAIWVRCLVLVGRPRRYIDT